jgi:peptidyl-prolyl cis-trans isomerase B (cyclophilin B)
VSPHLDGKYTAFGKVVQGLDVVQEIVDSVKDHFVQRDPRTHKPRVPQTILKAVVVKRR